MSVALLGTGIIGAPYVLDYVDAFRFDARTRQLVTATQVREPRRLRLQVAGGVQVTADGQRLGVGRYDVRQEHQSRP